MTEPRFRGPLSIEKKISGQRVPVQGKQGFLCGFPVTAGAYNPARLKLYYTPSGRLGRPDLLQDPAQILGLEGLLQHRPAAVPVWNAPFPIAGSEGEGDTPDRQGIGEIKHAVAVRCTSSTAMS
jgi:hypothetical protein